MATRITNALLKEQCEDLISYALASGGIPYVRGGASLAGMDCQSAAEYVLIQAGVPKAECNLAGSNTHYRKCRWVGTPEECCSLLSVSEVPVGFMMFIHDDDGDEPAKYQGDGKGNASHMGWYLGGGRTFNSSERNGGVVISTKFNGHATVPNGGWNRCGWSEWVDCGLTDAQIAALTGDASSADNSTPDDTTTPTVTRVDVSGFFKIDHTSKGGAVRRLQKWLNALGYSDVAVDGEFGPITETAVRDYQSGHGLEVDGIVGQHTWASMAAALVAKGVQG